MLMRAERRLVDIYVEAGAAALHSVLFFVFAHMARLPLPFLSPRPPRALSRMMPPPSSSSSSRALLPATSEGREGAGGWSLLDKTGERGSGGREGAWLGPEGFVPKSKAASVSEG